MISDSDDDIEVVVRGNLINWLLREKLTGYCSRSLPNQQQKPQRHLDDTFPLGINITGYNEAYLPMEGVHCSARICGLAGICTCTWAGTARSRGSHTG
jgi:hypothetical protein